MKAWQWYTSESMRLVDLPKPELKPQEVLVRVEAVGVCGSDIHYYRDGRIGENVIDRPVVLGHEYAGIVASVGSQADPALLGKRAAIEPGIPCFSCEWCRTGHYNVCSRLFFPGGPGSDGALCEYVAVDGRFCFPVSSTILPGCAAMVEPAAVAVHTVELAALKPGSTVAIFGLGVIGLLTAQMAKICGAVRVLGVDLIGHRVEVSTSFGVDKAFSGRSGGLRDGGAATIDWINEQTKGRGVDAAFDCTNSADGLALACAAARPAGTCVLTGISGNEQDCVPVSIARRRELTVHWCRRFLNNYPVTLALIDAGRLDVASLITHVFPFEKAPAAFALTAAYADGVLKALH